MVYGLTAIPSVIVGTALFAVGNTVGNGWMAGAGAGLMFIGFIVAVAYKRNVVDKKEVIEDGTETEEDTERGESEEDEEQV